jgi:ATP-dependent RNA helicase DDX5/DBP2
MSLILVYFILMQDFPNNVEDFIHRIGRTARGNATTGNSYTFFTNQKSDRSNAGALVDLMKDAEQDVPADLLNLVQHSRRPGSNNNRYGGSRGRGNSRGGRGNFSRNNNGYGRW